MVQPVGDEEHHFVLCIGLQVGKHIVLGAAVSYTHLDVYKRQQQMDVVGSTAAAAGLGDDQRGVIQIIFAAVQRVQELANDQQGRIAGIVVDIRCV